MQLMELLALMVGLIGMPSVIFGFIFLSKRLKFKKEELLLQNEQLRLEIEKERLQIDRLDKDNMRLDKIIEKEITG